MKLGSLLVVSLLAASTSAYAAESTAQKPAAQTPAAQTPTMDTRCFMVASAAAENLPDPQMKQMALMSSLFYLGRMSARMSDAEIETVALKEAKTLPTLDMPALLNQCGTFMGARGQAMNAIGQRMAAKAKGEASKGAGGAKK